MQGTPLHFSCYVDTKELLPFLSVRNPLNENPALHSLVTGVTAADNVNADCAVAVGRSVPSKWINCIYN